MELDLEFEIRKVIGIANYSKKRQFRNTDLCKVNTQTPYELGVFPDIRWFLKRLSNMVPLVRCPQDKSGLPYMGIPPFFYKIK